MNEQFRQVSQEEIDRVTAAILLACEKLDPGVRFEDGSFCGSTDVEHPPYEEDEYRCSLCGKRLRDEDK